MERRFVTRGVEAQIPHWLQNLMWHMRDTMEIERKDYLQVFTLSKTETGQQIVHTQENPDFRYEFWTECPDAVNEKVYIIDDETHVTMLLASEY